MKKIEDLEKGAHIHFMGICGVAMASLAGLLKEMGFKITGSDQNIYPPMSDQLKALDIPVMQGYKKETLDPKPDFVIVGNVITKKHEEAMALMESDIPYTSLPSAIGSMVIANKKSIVISGTHGKTTSTSIMSWILDYLKLDPGFLIGGIANNFGKSFELAKGDYFVIEGDEYDTAFFDKVPKFNHYKPYHVLLGAIEFDHADIYKDLSEVVTAFEGLATRSHPEGSFLYYAGNKNTVKVSTLSPSKNKYSYGIGEGDYQANNVQHTKEGIFFDFTFQGQKIVSVQSSMFGDYNILNLLSCLSLCHQLSLDMNQVREAILNFKGVKRRQEILAVKNNVTVIEDFAHHPSAVGMTIHAVKKRFSDAKVLVAFEPRSATSRTKIFQKDYIEAFSEADIAFIRKAYSQEKFAKENRFSSKELIEDLKKKGVDAHYFEDCKEAARDLAKLAKPGDAILIMSNGSFDGIYQDVIDLIQ